MNILIDTSIIIEHFRTKKKEDSSLNYFHKIYDVLYISTITEFKILRGTRPEQELVTKELLDIFIKLEFDSKIAKISAMIYQDLKMKGKPIDFPDLIIAGTALQFQFPLATLNDKHYRYIQKLELINKQSSE